MSLTRKGDAQRQRILDIALEVVAEQGFSNASLQRIADEAGVTPSGVMHYFSTKADLYTAVLQRRRQNWSELHEARNSIDSFLAAAPENMSKPGMVSLFHHHSVHSAGGEDNASDFFRYHYAEATQRLTAAVPERRHADRAALSDDTIARALVALFDGLELRWLHDPSTDLEADLRAVAAVLLSAADPAANTTYSADESST